MTDADLTLSELTYLNIDPRAYRYIRETAVKSIYDALMELITNSVDAYRSPYFNPTQDKTIDITLDAPNHELILVDNAVGLPGAKMQAYFMTVGAYTSSSQNRGFFSRGAKDLCAIGDIYFSTIYDGKLSRCMINTHGMGQVLAFDVPATETDRATYGIPGSLNGFHARLRFKSTFSYDEEVFLSNLQSHFAVRSFFLPESEFIFTLKFHKSNGETIETQLAYEHGNNTKIIDMTYKLDAYGYTNVEAKFELYQMDEIVAEHYDDDMRFNKYGILIDSGNAIHDNTAIHYTLRNNPNMRRLFGKITCPYINDLMYQLEESTPYDESKNPFPVINPSRQDGLDPKHPFTKALYDIPYKRTLFVLTELEDGTDPSNIQPNDISNLISTIQVMGTDIVNQLNSSNTNFVVVTRLVSHITNDVTKHSIVENTTLEYSATSIEEKMLLDINGDREVKPKFTVRFSDREMPYKYQIYKDINGFVLNISLKAMGVSTYIQNVGGEICGLNQLPARIVLANIITEALSRVIAESQFEALDFTQYDFKRIFRKFELIVNAVEKNVFTILVENTTSFNAISIVDL